MANYVCKSPRDTTFSIVAAALSSQSLTRYEVSPNRLDAVCYTSSKDEEEERRRRRTIWAEDNLNHSFVLSLKFALHLSLRARKIEQQLSKDDIFVAAGLFLPYCASYGVWEMRDKCFASYIEIFILTVLPLVCPNLKTIQFSSWEEIINVN